MLRDFFRPAWQHTAASKRETAVNELLDPALLTTIFRTDGSPAVKHAALERLIVIDRRQGESLFSVLLRHDLDASAVAFLGPTAHLSELIGNLGEVAWRTAIINKLRQSDPAGWPQALIPAVTEHEQSDDPALKAFAEEALRTYRIPLACRAVKLALLNGLVVKAVHHIDQFPVSAWAEQREGRTEFCVKCGRSDGWGSGIATCRSADDAAHEFVIAAGPTAALEAAACAAAPATPKPPERVVVGNCEACSRPLRTRTSALRPSMTLTCKCGHVNTVRGHQP